MTWRDWLFTLAFCAAAIALGVSSCGCNGPQPQGVAANPVTNPVLTVAPPVIAPETSAEAAPEISAAEGATVEATTTALDLTTIETTLETIQNTLSHVEQIQGQQQKDLNTVTGDVGTLTTSVTNTQFGISPEQLTLALAEQESRMVRSADEAKHGRFWWLFAVGFGFLGWGLPIPGENTAKGTLIQLTLAGLGLVLLGAAVYLAVF